MKEIKFKFKNPEICDEDHCEEEENENLQSQKSEEEDPPSCKSPI